MIRESSYWPSAANRSEAVFESDSILIEQKAFYELQPSIPNIMPVLDCSARKVQTVDDLALFLKLGRLRKAPSSHRD